MVSIIVVASAGQALGLLAQRGDHVALGPALEHVEAARAVRAVDDAPLDAEQRERLLTRDDAVDDRAASRGDSRESDGSQSSRAPSSSRNAGSVWPGLPRQRLGGSTSQRDTSA
jgi:hypothetical protein